MILQASMTGQSGIFRQKRKMPEARVHQPAEKFPNMVELSDEMKSE